MIAKRIEWDCPMLVFYFWMQHIAAEHKHKRSTKFFWSNTPKLHYEFDLFYEFGTPRQHPDKRNTAPNMLD